MRFSIELIEWYNHNKRDLPWRKTKDPYLIWLSEIILQQTRVDQGLSYFQEFSERFPTVNDLATANEDEVLKLWQGLGYYSRARNLHFTAKVIAKDYQGVFPSNYTEILALKGVGEYTAAAIASFSFKLPYPVIDGNVYRVLSRIFGIETPIDSSIGKKEFKLLANELIDKKNPATYNQAIMEFGALNCTPKLPNCENCIFNLECNALKNNLVNVLPKKEKKIKQRHRYFNYIVIRNAQYIYIKQRSEKDIWQGLYDFPLIETVKEIGTIADLNLKELIPQNFSLKNQSVPITHILSHQKIHATFWQIESKTAPINSKNYFKIDINNLSEYPVPKLIENYIKSMF